jgi:CrcB protein
VRHQVAAVAAGGAAGTLARFGALHAYPVGADTFPTAVLVVNLVASLLLGVLLAVLDPRRVGRPAWPAPLRPLLVAGVAGALSTLSAVVVDAALLVDHQRPRAALGYLAATALGGLVAVAVGLRAGGHPALARPAPEEDEL